MALDNLTIFGVEYSGVTGFKAQNSQSSTMVYIRPEGTSNITANGTYNVAAFSAASVLVTPTLSTITGIIPTETAQTISAPSGYDGLSTVGINAISSTYVGTGVTRRSAADLAVNGAYVTTPIGYYSQQVSKSIAAGVLREPTFDRTDAGLITATATVSSAGYLTPANSASSTYQLPTQAATTITPTTAQQTAVASGKWTTGSVIVDAIPAAYIIPTGTSNITSNGTYDIASFASVSVSVSGVGGYTLDQIARRASISGWISGSADKIGMFAFGSTNLSKTTFPSASIIGAYAFASCVLLKSIESTDFPSCSSIYSNAFANCPQLESVEFLSVVTVGSFAFQNCGELKTASFPAATRINTTAFGTCIKMTDIYIPEVKQIDTSAFSYCSALSYVDAPKLETLWAWAFASCISLVSVSVPKLETISSYAFFYCRALTSFVGPGVVSVSASIFSECRSLSMLSFSVLSTIASYAFRSLPALQSVSFPAAQVIGSYAFANCSTLSEISLPAATSFGTNVFASCWNLVSLNMTGMSSVPYLANSTNVFSSTPIGGYSTVAGQFGSIYVPSSLYAAFTIATNWSVYSARMVSV